MVDAKELQKKLQEISKLPKEEQSEALQSVLTADELAYLEEQQLAGKAEGKPQACAFCKIAAGEIPTKIVYEDSFVLAFLDINPAGPGHTLVIPKEHYEVLPQIPDDKAALLINTVKVLAGAIFEATNAQGVNILQNNGKAAGQAVPHVHFHVIPRFENDKIKFDWKPMKLEEKQMDELQERISKSASKAVKEVVYDVSGKPIEEEKKGHKAPKEKLHKVKPKLP